MDEQNPWWTGDPDPHLKKWESSPIRWIPETLDRISLEPFSLHFLLGPRQVGKTTILKLLIRRELGKRNPFSIYYLSCDRILDSDSLYRAIEEYDISRRARGIGSSLIVLDEITFVPQWWRAIKSRIDMGKFEKDVVILSGSASVELMKGREYFPGRRGKGRDHILFPLSFGEYCRKVRSLDVRSGTPDELSGNMDRNLILSNKISSVLGDYLRSGGFPLSIRDIYEGNEISSETLDTYINWLRGDWAKAGKSDQYMAEVIRYILRARGTPISWNSISAETSVNSPNTVKSYVETLQQIFSCNVLDMVAPDGKVLPRKNRKVHFSDPLLFKALSKFTGEKQDEGHLYEAAAASHLERWTKTYFWRNGSEVDIITIKDKVQTGYEITMGIKKWTKPRHIRIAYLIDRDNYHLFLSSL